MFDKLLQLLSISCRHSNMSKPFTASTTTVAAGGGEWEAIRPGSVAGHYVVCLDCGKKFGYDWNNMRVMK